MAKIACIGWGSLIWDPRNLPIWPEWYSDGPKASVEFLRKSNDGRVTLVLCDQFPPTQTLWSLMKTSDIAAAKHALCAREGISPKNIDKIHSSVVGQESSKSIFGISDWISSVGLDAAVWTGLGPKFFRADDVPSLTDVIAYLESLNGINRDRAEQYVRMAPRQVDTKFRRQIQKHFNWVSEDR